MSDPLRRDLVDGYARVNIGSGGLLGADAGQVSRTGSGVVARSVLAAGGVDLVEPGDDLHLVLDPLQRLHGAVELEVRTFFFRPPVGEVNAIRDINEGHTDRSARGTGRRKGGRRGGGNGARREHGLEGGNGHRNPYPFEEVATAQASVPLGEEGRCVERMVGFHGLVRVGRDCTEDAVFSATEAGTFRRFWNGADSITPINRAENRPPS